MPNIIRLNSEQSEMNMAIASKEPDILKNPISHYILISINPKTNGHSLINLGIKDTF